MYYTYVDETLHGIPFYVGMGDAIRVKRIQRNKHHTHICLKHGINRKIIGTFEDRKDAVELEIKLIAEYHTFVDDHAYNGIGCNYTAGGEGCACSAETKQKISDKQRGKTPWNKGRRDLRPRTEEEKQHLRNANMGARNAMFGKSPNWGKKHTDETRAKMRKPHLCSSCGQSGHTKRTCKSI